MRDEVWVRTIHSDRLTVQFLLGADIALLGWVRYLGQ